MRYERLFTLIDVGFIEIDLLSAALQAEQALDQRKGNQRSANELSEAAIMRYMANLLESGLLDDVNRIRPALEVLGKTLDENPTGGFTIYVPQLDSPTKDKV